MRTKYLWQAAPWVVILALLPAFQNCSKGLHAMGSPHSEAFQSTAECMQKSSGACIFEKSAVAMSGGSVTVENIGGYQSYSVPIEGLDQSGFLQNADFEVHTVKTDRLQRSQGFRHYYTPRSSHLEQLMVYYYADRVRNWIKKNGSFASSGSGVRLIVDSSFNGWVPSKKEVHFQRDGVRFPAALDGSLIVSLFSQSEVWAASAGESHSRTDTKTVTCADSSGYRSPELCCSSALGCGPALVSGIGDYMVARIFEKRGGLIGEGWKNSPAGQSLCGTPRDATQLRAFSVLNAYNLCSSRGSGGLVPAMGLLYASIWWEAREAATNKEQFDRFFVAHLSLIAGDDDFSTIKTKILNLDSASFNGQFGTLISSEFARRGL